MAARTAARARSPFLTPAEREREREQKREAVLRAAVQMFNARGFHATSLDDVAASLGISKPTVYHYLGNKDNVLFECVTRGLEQLQQAAEQAERLPGTGLDRLAAFLQRYAQINMDDYGRCVIRTGDEILSPDSARRFKALKRDIDDALRAMIQAGMDDRSIAPGDVKLIAFTLAGALNWPARWYDSARGASPEETARAMTDILIQGIAPK